MIYVIFSQILLRINSIHNLILFIYILLMLRKKNYKSELHYEYRPLEVPQPNGSKLTLYYRRYKPSPTDAPQNTLYDVLKNSKPLTKQPPKQQSQSVASKDRTLQILTFDHPLQVPLLRKVFRLIGKVRKIDTGQYRHKGKPAFFALVTFKFEYDLVKAFYSDHLQAKTNEAFRNVRVNQKEREEYMMDLVEEHGEQPKEEEVRRIQELREQGYQVVTDKYGSFELNRESNEKFVADLPQMRKKAKQSKPLPKSHPSQ